MRVSCLLFYLIVGIESNKNSHGLIVLSFLWLCRSDGMAHLDDHKRVIAGQNIRSRHPAVHDHADLFRRPRWLGSALGGQLGLAYRLWLC